MAYTIDLLIPRNTPKTAPVTGDIDFAPMLADNVSITFPAGCVGLVGIRFKYQSRVLWPYNTDAWYKGNDQAVEFTPNLKLEEEPLTLTIEGYNLDDTYQHTVIVLLDVEFKGGILDLWKTIFFTGKIT